MFSNRFTLGCVVLVSIGLSPVARPAFGQLQFENEPINYDTAAVHDRVAKLQRRLDEGQVTLRYDAEHGYLPAVLKQLRIPVSSQMLVFSKTSFQLRRISPQHPRAVYFSDDVYIGWVQEGEVVEVASVDPQQGAIFYTLSQQKSQTPRFVRDRGQCLTCHASSRTAGVPGLLVRSVFPDRRGHPMLGTRTYATDYRSPLSKRWGGWYVSGTHGAQRHMGNVLSTNRRRPEKIDVEAGANITDLSKRVDVSPYLSPHSDIVALMVLEHQSRVQDLITRANFEARIAVAYDQMMNEAFKRPASHRTESTGRRLKSVSEQLLDGLLFVDEYKLQAPIRGTSGFAREFSARGPRDSKGRSLRTLDLTRRLMKYPCSYLIYSAAFDGLPAAIKDRLYSRLLEVLTGEDHSKKFSHLTIADRTAILEILRETKQDLPDDWNALSSTSP